MSSELLIPSREVDLADVFGIIDKDKSGSIDHAELFNMVRLVKPGATKADLLKMFAVVDESKDGKINKAEFVHHYVEAFKADTAAEFHERMNTTRKYLVRKPALSEVFDKYDSDKSGGLDKGEIYRMVKLVKPTFTNEELLAMFKHLDTDHSKQIEKEEFIRYFFNLFKADTDREFEERIETTLQGRRRVKLQAVFNCYDLNADGVLDLQEFAAMLRLNGRKFVSADEILDTLIKLDKDKNKKVEFKEWMDYMSGIISYMDDTRFDKAVKNMFDAAKKEATVTEKAAAAAAEAEKKSH